MQARIGTGQLFNSHSLVGLLFREGIEMVKSSLLIVAILLVIEGCTQTGLSRKLRGHRP